MPTILGRFHQVERTSGFFMRSLLPPFKTLLPMVWMALIIIYSSAQIISGTHNPFLYFRF
jgi:hypothetical protein